jgi:hypothetical protein
MMVVVMAVFGVLAALVALGVALVLDWPAWLVFPVVMLAFNAGVVLLLVWFWFRDAWPPKPKGQAIVEVDPATDADVQPGVTPTK